MHHPRVVAEASLPPVLSFTEGPDPELVLSLTLVDSEEPITVSKDNQSLFTLVNAITIFDRDDGDQEVRLPTIDKNMKFAPSLQLVPEQANRFMTLEPNVPAEIRAPFRPLGPEKSNDGTRTGVERYRFLRLGMHLLKPGKEYVVRVRNGLQIYSWMTSRKEDLIPRPWQPVRHTIAVVAAEGVRFRVEE